MFLYFYFFFLLIEKLFLFNIKLKIYRFCFFFFLFLQKSADDTSQFDEQFTATVPVDSPVESTLSESANLIFQVSKLIKNFNHTILRELRKEKLFF